MEFGFAAVRLQKRYPLMISRGLSTGSTNLFVTAEEEGLVGWGECAPGVGYNDEGFAETAEQSLRSFLESLAGLPDMGISGTLEMGRRAGVPPPALAGLDMALWDLFAKGCMQPLYRVFGLVRRSVPTSVTIGILPPEVIRERVPEILDRTDAQFLKIKLGQPAGIEADQAAFATVRETAPPQIGLRVDANGGWSVDAALAMMSWLAERGCEYVEQPLPAGQEHDLPHLFESRPLPIFADESCHTSQDIPKLAGKVDGVNLKLMKTGGLTEALRAVATARAHGMKTMIGCMGESSVAIAAGASIASLFDHVDLDSNLNLSPDPAAGTEFSDGVLLPMETPGHGGHLLHAPA